MMTASIRRFCSEYRRAGRMFKVTGIRGTVAISLGLVGYKLVCKGGVGLVGLGT